MPHSTTTLPLGSVTTKEQGYFSELHCMRFGFSQKRVLPLPEPPITSTFLLLRCLRVLRAAVHRQALCLRQNDIVLEHPGQCRAQYPHAFPMKRFVKCFFELLTQIIVKVRKCKVQRVCVLHFQLAGSGGCFFLMKLYH